jgi:hypothetical protein
MPNELHAALKNESHRLSVERNAEVSMNTLCIEKLMVGFQLPAEPCEACGHPQETTGA